MTAKKKREFNAAALILRALKDLPQTERLDALALACAAWIKTNGAICG